MWQNSVTGIKIISAIKQFDNPNQTMFILRNAINFSF
jgi:hypothetical protein